MKAMRASWLRMLPVLTAGVLALTLGGFALAGATNPDGKDVPLRAPSAGRDGTPSPEEEARIAGPTKIADERGALTVALNRAGTPVALFPADKPGQPIEGIRVKTSPYTSAEYKEIEGRLAELAGENGNYSYAFYHDVDTGQLRIDTNAPTTDIQTLRGEFGDRIVVTPESGPQLSARNSDIAPHYDGSSISAAGSTARQARSSNRPMETSFR